MGANWPVDTFAGKPAAIALPREMPLVVGYTPGFKTGSRLANDHAVTRCCRPIAVQFDMMPRQDMGAAIPHQCLVRVAADQRRYGIAALCDAIAANIIYAIGRPQGRDRYGVAAVGKRTIVGNQVTDCLSILQALEALGETLIQAPPFGLLAVRKSCNRQG